jgi:hypothetical protein
VTDPSQPSQEDSVPQSPAQDARPRPLSSVERVMAKESFAPDEPLPAFTFPAIDDAQKEELLRRVEAAQSLSAEPKTLLHVAASAPSAEARPSTPARTVKAVSLLSKARRFGRDAWARVSVEARQGFVVASRFVDRNRSRLPSRVRKPLDKVPADTIVAAFGLLVVGVLVTALTVAVLRTGHAKKDGPDPAASAAPPAAPKDPVPQELDDARKLGHSALEKLAAKYPKDARVWLELAASSSAKGDSAAAVSAVGKALAVDPQASEQPLAGEVLAQVVRKRPTINAAFDLLQGPMQSAGATVLYDLSIDPNVALTVRSGAEAWVRSPAFKSHASEPDVALAGALRYAASCTARHDLLPTAAEKGGQRTLAFLKIAKAPAGCGRNARKDCFPCLRQDDALKGAISAIEKRLPSRAQ